jgi:4-amino-4-deoxy-L-arabinose transferase-like glycosyltransferase
VAGPRARRGLEAGGLVAALVLGLALRWTTPAAVQDLRPRPDAMEYEEAARRLAHGDGYWLHIGGKRYPPRYPPGFSALIAPALLVLGDEPGTSIVVVLATAGAAIVATWALARVAAGPAAAAVAALLLATAPLHVQLSGAVMSEVPSSAAVAAVALLVLGAARRASAAWWSAVGVAAGLAATIRQPNVLLLLPAAGITLTARGISSSTRLRHLAGLAAGAGLGMAPLLVQQWHRFGSPLATGYGYWVADDLFRASYVLGPPFAGGSEPNALFYGAAALGLRSLYGWSVAILAGAGTVMGLGRGGAARTLAILGGGFLGALWLLHAFFFWQAERFLLPAVPLVTAVAAVPLARAARPLWRVLGLALVVHALLRPLVEPRAYEPASRGVREVPALRTLAQETAPNAAIALHTNPFLFARLLRAGTADRLWLPLGVCEWMLPIRLRGLQAFGAAPDGAWMLEPVDHPARIGPLLAHVRSLLAAGRPVYVSTFEAGALPYFGAVLDALRRHFVLEDVPQRGGAALLRVLPR